MTRIYLLKNANMHEIYQLMKKTICLLFIFLTVSESNINSQNSSSFSKSREIVTKKSTVNADSLLLPSVYAPVLLNSNTKIFNWAITSTDFYKVYLNSMVMKYSLFVPTDEYFTKYIDPVTFATDVPGVLKFWYNSKTSSVNATIYRYNKQTGIVGDSLGVITSGTFLTNRLIDLLKSHIVVGDVESGSSLYMTKGNVPLKIKGSGTSMIVQEGGDVNLNENAHVTRVFKQSNGNTYFIDKPLQSPLTSVYKVLSETPEFSQFFALLAGFPENTGIFVNNTNNHGIDFNVKFFNTFNYTVYVPTNDVIKNAIQSGLIIPWETQGSIKGINNMTDATSKASAILKLERFLRYHFQDYSVFINDQIVNNVYHTATIKNDDAVTNFGTFKNKFYKIGVSGYGSNLTLTTESNKTIHVITTNGLYNIMTRDYVFNGTFKNIDGTGDGMDFSMSLIYTSSTAVIHQIDNVLTFQ
jgi:uncharacterized surface protein with fasciclin (FAS1) repeats